jgi:hypothetical protein
VKEGETALLEELVRFDKDTEKQMSAIVSHVDDLQRRVNAQIPPGSADSPDQLPVTTDSHGASFFAVGVNTGFDVQSKRIPPVLSSWLSTSEAGGLAMKYLILSDTSDADLHVSEVPQPYLCSKYRSASAATYRLPTSGGGTGEDYFSDWGWLKPGAPKEITPTMVARRTMRCIQYRFLYVIPELLRKFGGDAEYYFLADDDIFTAWPTVLKAMKNFSSPDEKGLVGFDGENSDRCRIRKSVYCPTPCGPKHNYKEYSLFGGLFGFTRAAALLFNSTIANTASEFQFYRMNGCTYDGHNHVPASFVDHHVPNVWKCAGKNNSEIAQAFDRCTKLIQDTVSSESSASLEGVLEVAGCHPSKLVRDFAGGEYIYFSGHWTTNDQNDDVVISYWAKKYQLNRTTWKCLQFKSELILQGPKHPKSFHDRPISTWHGNTEWGGWALKGLATHLGSPNSQELLVIHHLSVGDVAKSACFYAEREANPKATGADLWRSCKDVR